MDEEERYEETDTKSDGKSGGDNQEIFQSEAGPVGNEDTTVYAWGTLEEICY